MHDDLFFPREVRLLVFPVSTLRFAVSALCFPLFLLGVGFKRQIQLTLFYGAVARDKKEVYLFALLANLLARLRPHTSPSLPHSLK